MKPVNEKETITNLSDVDIVEKLYKHWHIKEFKFIGKLTRSHMGAFFNTVLANKRTIIYPDKLGNVGVYCGNSDGLEADKYYQFHCQLAPLKFRLKNPYLLNVDTTKSISLVEDFELTENAGKSTKISDTQKTGYKGIGFKSVFSDAQTVYINSGNFSFRFDKDYYRDIAFETLYEYHIRTLNENGRKEFFARYKGKEKSQKRSTYKNGPVAIYLRFTVDGQRAEASTGKTCEPSRWNAQAGRAIGTKEDIRTLNAYLDTLQAKAQEFHRWMTANDEMVTAESLKNRFIGKTEKEFEKSTLQRYETALMHTKDFMQWQHNVSDIPINKINFEFLNDFEYYLRSVRRCYTGLAYVDVKKLKRSEMVKGIDDDLWIYTNRQKTDTLSRIPILPAALKVIERYEDNPQCIVDDLLLPVMSNQKMNAYLKEIADLCGISKLLTFHIARHTFATTVTLNNGVPIESVAKMMVKPGTLDLIHTLMRDQQFNSFYLVGGTALALKLGHRESIDIDLFNTGDFDAVKLAAHLEKQYEALIRKQKSNYLNKSKPFKEFE
eukprot:gene10938-11021_t